MRDAITEIFNRNGSNNAGTYMQDLEGKLQKIQPSAKNENGNGTTE